MNWLHKQPISTKLKVLNLASSGTVIILASLMLLLAQYFFFNRNLLESTRSHAAMVSENVSAALVFSDKNAAREILSSLRATTDIKIAAIYDPQGDLFVSYYRNIQDEEKYLLPLHAPQPGYVFSSQHLILSQPIDLQGKRIGSIYLQDTLSSVHTQLAWYSAASLAIMGISLLIANLILLRLQKEITDPILSLARTSEHISERNDYTVRAEAGTSGEIGQLANSFNHMLEHIQKRDSELEAEITHRKGVEAHLDRLAHYDNLTGLSNRHFVNERLSSVVSRAMQFEERAVVIFIDLDNFKIVNDTLGHDAGDALLCIAAERLSKSLRFGDVISRLGGDEFALILENVEGVGQAVMVAENCLDGLADPFLIDGNELFVGASIGISVCPDDSTDVSELLKHADTAMYYAKNNGKNSYQMFLPGMKDAAQKRMVLEGRLRHALERNEFVLYYQPQIDLETRRMTGVEALIRWMPPGQGIVNPDEFIPIAEESSLIVPIGEWVLKTACLQLKAWHDTGLTQLTMSINLSGRQLKEEKLVDRIKEIVLETGADSTALHLELTESMLMDARLATIDKLQQICAIGVRLSIDDFGTGYSSLSYLKRFPISTLKVDKSFVRELPGNTDDAAITKAIIAMAQSLKMHVIAEGVETPEQAEYLLANGCKNSQGFLFSEAVPAEQITQWIEQENTRSRIS